MRLVKKKGLQIATSKQATQLIINCHGGWGTEDGYTKVPGNTKLYFYTKHGEFALGTGVVDAVLSNPHEAKVGLKKTLPAGKQQEIRDGFQQSVASLVDEYKRQLGIKQTEIDAVLNALDARGRQQAENHLKSKIEEALLAKKTPQSMIDKLVAVNLNPQLLNREKYVAEKTAAALTYVCSLYDGFGAGRPVFDYSLSMETEPIRKKTDFDAKLEKHMKGENSVDVDLLQLYESPVHLSDVFQTLEDLGMTYAVIHFGACRFVRATLPSS